MKIRIAALLLLSFASSNTLAETPQCAADAIVQAKKLIAFHTDGDDRAEVESRAKMLPSISNPANKKQRFIVLEVMGYVYKSSNRMRFIYYPANNYCILMGQEILGLADM